MNAVQNAIGQGGGMNRTALSSDSLHRLTKCLRSHGVLDEYTTRKEESSPST